MNVIGAKLKDSRHLIFCLIGNILKCFRNDSVRFVLFTGLMVHFFGRLYAYQRKYCIAVNSFLSIFFLKCLKS